MHVHTMQPRRMHAREAAGTHTARELPLEETRRRIRLIYDTHTPASSSPRNETTVLKVGTLGKESELLQSLIQKHSVPTSLFSRPRKSLSPRDKHLRRVASVSAKTTNRVGGDRVTDRTACAGYCNQAGDTTRWHASKIRANCRGGTQ